MRFLENIYKPYSIKWFIQRTIMIVKERRLPQIGYFLRLKPKEITRVQESKPTESLRTVADIQYNNTYLPISRSEVKIPESQKKSNLINTYFDCIYLLNLKNRSEKRLKSILQLEKTGINAWIVDGIDGYQQPHKEEYEQYYNLPLYEKDAHPLEFRLKRKCISSPGAWGVLKSKKMIFLDAHKNQYRRILILQDDLIFIKDFHSRFSSFINNIDDDWKIIALGATQHKWDIPDYLSYQDQAIKDYDPHQKFYYPLITDGAFALGYDSSVFPLIIHEIDKMNCSFDSGAVRAVYAAYPGKCFVCQPNLIIADVSTSDIRSGRNQAEFSAKIKWDLSLYDYHVTDEVL